MLEDVRERRVVAAVAEPEDVPGGGGGPEVGVGVWGLGVRRGEGEEGAEGVGGEGGLGEEVEGEVGVVFEDEGCGEGGGEEPGGVSNYTRIDILGEVQIEMDTIQRYRQSIERVRRRIEERTLHTTSKHSNAPSTPTHSPY